MKREKPIPGRLRSRIGPWIGIALILLGLFASTPLPESGRAWADNR